MSLKEEREREHKKAAKSPAATLHRLRKQIEARKQLELEQDKARALRALEWLKKKESTKSEVTMVHHLPEDVSGLDSPLWVFDLESEKINQAQLDAQNQEAQRQLDLERAQRNSSKG